MSKTNPTLSGEPRLDVEPTPLPGVRLIKPRVFGDARGCFLELYRRERYVAAGIEHEFVQDNVSRSVRGVLRGMHYQLHSPQAKVVGVVSGAVLDVVVDVQHGSPTFGQSFGIELNDTNRWQLFVPEGFAHGFLVISEVVYFFYKCSTVYNPADERGIHYESIDFKWPITQPIVSDRDRQLPPLTGSALEDLPKW